MTQTDRKLILAIMVCCLFIFMQCSAFADKTASEPFTAPDKVMEAKTERENMIYSIRLNDVTDKKFSKGPVLVAKRTITQFGQKVSDVWSKYYLLDDDTIVALNKLADFRGAGYMGKQFLLFFLLLGCGFLAEYFFSAHLKRIKKDKKQCMATCLGTLFSKIFLRTLVDASRLIVFLTVVLLGFVFFIPEGSPLYKITVAYIPEVIFIRLVWIVLKAIYSPADPHLRIVPQNCKTTGLYFIGILSFVIITNGFKQTLFLLWGNGLSLNSYLLYFSIIGLIQFLILATILWLDRSRIARILMNLDPNMTQPAGSDTGKTSGLWTVFGLLVLTGFEILWQLNLLLYEKDLTLPLLLTVFSIPFGYLLYSIGNRLLLIASGRIELLDPREINKDILPPGMDLFEKLNLEPPAPDVSVDRSENGSIIEPYLPVMRKMLGTLISLMVFLWVFDMWGLEIPVGVKVISSSVTIFITILLAYIIWEICRAYIDHKIQEESPLTEGDEDPEGGSGGSRKATILTLLRRVLFSALAIIVFLTIMKSLGIDIAPLLAGAGILGLAIGFGSQALVRDILSGLFFLIDDAFRVGDYIETGNIKGAVQEISLRSVKVRHPRGMVFTIPYGGMGSVKNFSRDYIITKLDIRVRYDADINKIRKIIKKINKKVSADEDLGPTLLSKIKSQGVREMDDSAMILRVKFKTIPGEQFMVRRMVYQLIQEKFRENNIEFAHKNVTVYLPESADNNNLDKDKALNIGAAAASAAIENKAMPQGKPAK